VKKPSPAVCFRQKEQTPPPSRAKLSPLTFHDRHPKQIDRASAQPALAGNPRENACRGVLHDGFRRCHRAGHRGRLLRAQKVGASGSAYQFARKTIL
jgi:hypothetical protein